MEIGFEQLKDMKLQDIKKIEDVYSELPETGFKMSYNNPEAKQKSAEDLVEEILNDK